MDGLYTLANDVVLEQVVALLNSIEANAGRRADGSPYPVIICPYDDRLDRLRAAIADRPHVQLWDDPDSIAHWDRFAQTVWDNTPNYRERMKLAPGQYHRMGTHRRFVSLDGPFDRFIYLDADTLVLQPLAPLFAALDEADWVVYDFQHKDPTHVYTVDAPVLTQTFSADRVAQEIFCSGMYGARRGLFPEERLTELLAQLRSGEAELLYPSAPDQSLLNYMVMRSNLRITNLALSWPKEQVTGNSVTSPHFVERSGQVFDRDRPLIYLHYIGLSSALFDRLCGGENLDIPYRDTFLHYRYLQHPEQRPALTGRPRSLNPAPTLWQRFRRKVKRLFA